MSYMLSSCPSRIQLFKSIVHISSGPLIEKTSSSLLQALCKQSDMVVDHKHVMVVSSSSTTIKIASIDAIYKIALLSYIHDRRSCIDTYLR